MSADTDYTPRIRCLAIDDEPLARLKLESYIRRTPYLELAGTCQDAFKAMKYIDEGGVDALFVDINMPDMNGMELVASLTNPPLIVFTTAYSEYALEGYKVNAIDYLLKPFGIEEFQKAAEKVRRQYNLMHPVPHKKEEGILNQEEDVLYLKVDYKLVRIAIHSIRYIVSMREYLRLYLDNGEKPMTLMPISRMSGLLKDKGFIRVHRSYIVNMDKVAEVSKVEVKLKDGHVVPIGDTFRDDLKQFIAERIVQ